MSEGINVLSTFDGMSCGQIALERAGIKVNKYYASEIKPHAIKVTQHNYPNTIQLGCIKNISAKVLDTVDLLIGGSPCQDISNLNKEQKGLQGVKSSLFFEYVRLYGELKSKNPNLKFLLENVVGKKEAVDTITSILGVQPIKINSKSVTPQNRNRYYWTNISGIEDLESKPCKLKDILEHGVDEKYYILNGRLRWILGESGKRALSKKYISIDPIIANCLTKRAEPSWNCNYVTDGGRLRKLTPVEWERLQTVPDNYTSQVSDNHRYDMLGDGWTIDVISHIFKNLNV